MGVIPDHEMLWQDFAQFATRMRARHPPHTPWYVCSIPHRVYSGLNVCRGACLAI
jgi:hypothetical protein